MSAPTLASILLASTDPARLRSWYVSALAPEDDVNIGGYWMLKFGWFYLMIDTREDVAATNPEPGRVILNFDVDDARAVAARMDRLGARWLVGLENREGSLFGTAIDPDGNYVQIIELSEETKAAMSAGAA